MHCRTGNLLKEALPRRKAISPVSEPRDIIRTYLTSAGLFTFGTSLIWAVNTLFLLRAGLDIFTVMVVNAAFTAGQLVFEVPTGVVADTIGRRASFLLGIAAIAASTVLYVLAAQMAWGLWAFAAASVLLGFGFTCQTGATDAWLVDGLAASGYPEPLDGVFAKGQVVFGIATLAGTIAGGVLGQIDLAVPYYARAAVLVLVFAYVSVRMHDVGFAPRPLKWRSFGDETRTILRAGSRFGWQNPVVRPLLFASLVQGTFFIFGFYSWQRYFLDLLTRELVWVNGLVTAAFAVAGILGNMLVKRVMNSADGSRSAGRVLATLATAQAGFVVAAGLVGVLVPRREWGIGPFALAVVLYLAFGLLTGVQGPVRQAFLNRQIPSAQRATVLSLDAFFGDGGASAGQLGFGWLSRAVSIPLAWSTAGLLLFVAAPLYARSGRSSDHPEVETVIES